jgi:hypothetical protein
VNGAARRGSTISTTPSVRPFAISGTCRSVRHPHARMYSRWPGDTAGSSSRHWTWATSPASSAASSGSAATLCTPGGGSGTRRFVHGRNSITSRMTPRRGSRSAIETSTTRGRAWPTPRPTSHSTSSTLAELVSRAVTV